MTERFSQEIVCHGDKSMTERFGHNDVIAIVGIWTTVQPSVRQLDPADFSAITLISLGDSEAVGRNKRSALRLTGAKAALGGGATSASMFEMARRNARSLSSGRPKARPGGALSPPGPPTSPRADEVWLP